MKGKINIKTIVIIIVSLVVIALLVFGIIQVRTMISSASSDVEPQGVTVVLGDDGKTATITWMSNKESIAKVEYGTTAASLVLMSAESSMTTDHRILLSSLRPGTMYYYRIRVGEEIFDNEGIPYQFKTKSDTPVAVATVTTVPVAPPSQVTESSTLVCDFKTDYNKDGVVNSFDLMACKNDGGKVIESSLEPTSTINKIVTPVAGKVNCNDNTIDYNGDGVINSIDKIKCLQSQK